VRERGREFVYERERESAKAKKRMNEKEFRIHIITHPLPRHSVYPHGFYLSFASRFQVPKRLKMFKKKQKEKKRKIKNDSRKYDIKRRSTRR
jgi:hypothetical protein